MKKIDIQLIFQEPDSLDCGPTCVQMILKYFNLEKDIAELKETLQFNENGTSIYDNGLSLLNAGLTVTAITAQPYLFSPDVVLKNKEEVISQINERTPKLDKFAKGIKVLNRFLEAQGDLQVEIPSFKHIKDAIDNNNPVLALIYGRALGSKEGGFHFVIVNGYDEGKVFITNPLEQARTGWFPLEEFFYALHTSTLCDIDNGTFLVVSR